MHDGRTQMFDVDIEVVSYLCRAGRDEGSWEPWLLLLLVVDIVGEVIDGFL